jgi:hypothetical protein
MNTLQVVRTNDRYAPLEVLSAELVDLGDREDDATIYHASNIWYTAIPNLMCATATGCTSPLPLVAPGGTVTFHVTKIDEAPYVGQLLDKSGKPVKEVLSSTGDLTFTYVKPGEYFLRLFSDANGNGIWDTGDYDSGLQAEPVFYNNEQVECKMKWDVNRKWSLTALPRYRQKPQSITKQKPDQAKKQQNRNAQRAAEKGIPYPIKTK